MSEQKKTGIDEALRLYQSGKWKESAEAFRGLITLNMVKPSGLYIIYGCIGHAYYNLKDYAASLEWSEKSIACDLKEARSEFVDAVKMHIAASYYECGKFPEALAVINCVLNKSITDKCILLTAYRCRARIYIKLGYFEKARSDTSEALSYATDSTTIKELLSISASPDVDGPIPRPPGGK